MLKLGEYRQNKNGVPRRFLTVYKPEIKQNADYLDSLHQQKNNTLLKAFYVKKSDVCATSSQEPAPFIQSKDVNQLCQFERLELTKHFNLEVLSLLDFWNPTECNAVTNGLLKRLCRNYGTQLSLIETADSLPLGLVFRHRAWLASNASGLLSCSFVFPVRGITPDALLHLVNFVAGHAQYAIGSNDILLIGEPEETTNWLETLSRFSPIAFQCGIAYIE